MANLNIPSTKDRTLDAFKGKMVGGGARPNLFECELFFPVAPILVPFRGRNLKIAGDRTFDPWTITVINDVDFKIRTAFERWMNLINKHEDNSGLVDPTAYQKDLFVRQLGRSSLSGPGPASDPQLPVLKMYKFHGTFPTNISDIPLSYDSSDTIEEFTVELQVQWVDVQDSQSKTQIGTGA
jgi:hypothetical protein